ncbi:MAG: hypothetical protein FGM46_06335 [Ferruginibacter sp.]|nr:hypothetical protein [Ferruginibacter sp.]
MTLKISPWEVPDRKNLFSRLLGYYHQVIVVRKFSENLSAQITPALVHLNLAQGIKTLVELKLFYKPKKKLPSLLD